LLASQEEGSLLHGNHCPVPPVYEAPEEFRSLEAPPRYGLGSEPDSPRLSGLELLPSMGTIIEEEDLDDAQEEEDEEDEEDEEEDQEEDDDGVDLEAGDGGGELPAGFGEEENDPDFDPEELPEEFQ